MAMSGKFDPKMLSALDLAFVGDGVYGLLVREMLARDGSRPVGELHRMAVCLMLRSLNMSIHTAGDVTSL